jgi:uncharacterized protein YoaH (UPF0181 family)
MTKIEIEVTDEQLEKIEILKDNGISVGQAINLLFKVQNEIKTQVEENHPDDDIMEKIQNTDFDVNIKAEIIEKTEPKPETYDVAIEETRRKVKWSEFFKL